VGSGNVRFAPKAVIRKPRSVGPKRQGINGVGIEGLENLIDHLVTDIWTIREDDGADALTGNEEGKCLHVAISACVINNGFAIDFCYAPPQTKTALYRAMLRVFGRLAKRGLLRWRYEITRDG